VSSNLTGSQKTATDSRTSRLDPENPTGINLDETDAE
jgi:hypothetical protein